MNSDPFAFIHDDRADALELVRELLPTPHIGSPYPRKVIVRGQTTVVLWSDGTRTKSTCSQDDKFDVTIGFSRCLCKKMFTKKQFEKVMRKVEIQEE